MEKRIHLSKIYDGTFGINNSDVFLPFISDMDKYEIPIRIFHDEGVTTFQGKIERGHWKDNGVTFSYYGDPIDIATLNQDETHNLIADRDYHGLIIIQDNKMVQVQLDFLSDRPKTYRMWPFNKVEDEHERTEKTDPKI